MQAKDTRQGRAVAVGTDHTTRIWWTWLLLALTAALLLLSACAREGDYVHHGDTSFGATYPDVSETPGAPDSTLGVSDRVMHGAPAGDRLGRSDQNQSVPVQLPPADTQPRRP